MIFFVLTNLSCKDEMHDKIIEEQRVIEDSINKTPAGNMSNIKYDTFETVTIEGCEYLIYKEHPSNNRAMGFMAHKGNCKNPIHCRLE